ncbi:MAG: hypothetical protein E7497_04310 [Ruminococcus sp.]|nr:hypothetical protein [Ruminococcus sp.]
MDNVIAAAVIVLAVITSIEAVSLFYRSSHRAVNLSFAAVLPVFPDDINLRRKLDYLRQKLSDNTYFAEEIILVNYGATVYQLEICREFCDENENAILTDPASVEKILSKTFAIERKI